MADPTPLDAIANISITLYGDGQMSISGNIEDINLAESMLDHAKDSVRRQWLGRKANGIQIPGSDVDVKPELPLTQYGDAPKEMQGRLASATRGGVLL